MGGVKRTMLRMMGLVALLSAAQGFAQITVQVLDAMNGAPVPYAHIQCTTLDDGAVQLSVSGPDGRNELPLAADRLKAGVLIHVSFVGYMTWSDTVRIAGPIECRLRRDALYLDEFVVTGQYAPGSVEAAVQRLRVIDAQRIKRMAAQHLGDALRDQLNVRLAQDNVLGASVSMMGLGGENVKVLIDGVPVTGRQNGNVDLSQIDLTGIERIEVVEGPMSVNYGSNALAGTLNLITRKTSAAAAWLKASVYTEHIGRLNAGLTGTRRIGRNEVVLSAGRNFFGGWDPREQGIPAFGAQPADTSRYQQWKPREQYFARVNYRWIGERWTLGWKGEGLHDLILDRGRPRAPYNETAFDARYLTLRLDNALFAEGRVGRHGRVNALAAHNIYERRRNTWLRDLTTLGEELAVQPGMNDTVSFTLSNVRGTYAFAPDSGMWSFELGTDLNLERGAGDRIAEDGKEIGDYAFYGSAELRLRDALTLRPGVRWAYNTRYGAPVIPAISLRWQMPRNLVLRASYAQGFRAPSLKELYLYFVDVNHDIVGNPDLKAERSHSATASIAYRHARARSVYTSELSLFGNDVSDLITLAQIQGTQYSYVNIGRMRTMGGTVGAGWDNGHWIVSVGAGMTWMRDPLAEELGADWLTMGEARASLTRQWMKKGWSANLLWKLQGTRMNYMLASDGALQRSEIGAFHLADANVSKRLWSDRLAATLGCKDLFNVRNLTATTTGGVHSSGSTVPMTTGRTFFLRLELDLKRKA